MITEYFFKLWSKVIIIFLISFLYFSSLNLKYLELTKMDLTRFAMKLYCTCTIFLVVLKSIMLEVPTQVIDHDREKLKIYHDRYYYILLAETLSYKYVIFCTKFKETYCLIK